MPDPKSYLPLNSQSTSKCDKTPVPLGKGRLGATATVNPGSWNFVYVCAFFQEAIHNQ